jgi:hypothetical protein
LPETTFKENIAKLENVYKTLIKGDAEPGKESEFRVEIIDIISNIEAAIIGEKSSNENFIGLLAKLREDILAWNAHGAIFRQQIGIVDLFNELFFKAKSVVFEIQAEVEAGEEDQPVLEEEKSESNNSEATRLKKELASMKSELGDLKELITSLMKEKATAQKIDAPQQPVVEEQPQEVIAPVLTEEKAPESQLPWNRKPQETIIVPEPPQIETEPVNDPPVLLPIISEDTPEPVEDIGIVPPAVEEESGIGTSATIQKLSETHTKEMEPAHVINQMKSIISEAEEKTRREISAFKDKMQEEVQPPVIAPTKFQGEEFGKIEPPVIESHVAEALDNQKITEQVAPIIPPTEPFVEKVIPEEPDTDPYMQLLTLEAEKYRLEKEIEKNETDFQEGMKNRQEFDENINKINSDLVKVREQIDLLRQQLIT